MKTIAVHKLLSFFVLIILLSGCGADKVASSYKIKPVAMGKTNQLVVIADQDIWDGPVGDSLRFYYSTAYPILPQPEPIFDLQHFTVEDLDKEPLRRELRTYMVLGDLNYNDSPAAKMIIKDLGKQKTSESKQSLVIVKDRWADGQKFFYLFGNGEAQLIQNLTNAFPTVSKKINEFDLVQVDANAYLGQENRIIQNAIKERFGFDIKIPSNYKIALDTTDLMWIRQDDQVSVNNILIKKIPYTDKSQISKAGIKEIRNEFGKMFVTTSAENPTYMRVNDVDLPMYTKPVTIDGKYALEARGIWEIVGDFMGGSFISYLILDEAKSELIYIDGFIHAPGKKKRDYIQRLEHIIYSTTF